MWCCMYVVADNDAAIVVPEQERRKEPKVYRPKYEIESSMKLAKKIGILEEGCYVWQY